MSVTGFGVSEFTTWPWPFERDIEEYPRSGAAFIEVCEFKLNRADYEPQLRALRDAGLRVSSVQSTVHSLYPDSLAPQPVALEDRVRHIETAIERIAPHVPGGTPFVVITGAAPNGNAALAWDNAARSLDRLASFAQRRGMRVAFEPLNPVLFNTDTALWGLDDGLDLVRRVGRGNLGLCVDTWNVFQTPDLHDVIAAASDRIFIVQLSDWQRPRSGADRRCLGDGTIPTARILKSIRRSGYDGPYVLEIFSGESLPDSLWRGDLTATLRKNAAAFARIWEESAV